MPFSIKKGGSIFTHHNIYYRTIVYRSWSRSVNIMFSLDLWYSTNMWIKSANFVFLNERYYVSTLGLNKAIIKKYIKEQERHDIVLDKSSTNKYENTFNG